MTDAPTREELEKLGTSLLAGSILVLVAVVQALLKVCDVTDYSWWIVTVTLWWPLAIRFVPRLIGGFIGNIERARTRARDSK